MLSSLRLRQHLHCCPPDGAKTHTNTFIYICPACPSSSVSLGLLLDFNRLVTSLANHLTFTTFNSFTTFTVQTACCVRSVSKRTLLFMEHWFLFDCLFCSLKSSLLISLAQPDIDHYTLSCSSSCYHHLILSRDPHLTG